VTAPLDLDHRATVPLGSRIACSGNPTRPTPKNHRGQGPENGWRGGGPPCPLRWIWIAGKPSPWAANRLESEPPLDIQQKTPLEWAQQQGGGSADLCDRSAGFESEETRANGQPRDMDRQGTLRWEHNPIYCSTFSCSTLSAPGRWAFVRKHPIRCAEKSPWIGQETPLDSSRIPPSSHERHPSKPCPEGTFFHSPGFVRSTTLGDRTNRSHQP